MQQSSYWKATSIKNVITAINGSTVFGGTGVSQQEYREAVRSTEGFDWICGPCLVDINVDSQEDDDTLIDQLGGYVVPPLIVEPDVSVTIPVNAQDCEQSTSYIV